MQTAEEREKRRAKSRAHLMTHLPFCAWCPICVAGKALQNQARAKEREYGNPEVDPQKFGDLLLADDIILQNPLHWGSKDESAGLMMKDVGTGWRDIVGMDDKGAENHKGAFLEFVGNRHGQNLGTVHSDGAGELKKSVRDLQGKYNWVHSVACPPSQN